MVAVTRYSRGAPPRGPPARCGGYRDDHRRRGTSRGLEVTGTPMARQAGGAAQRWQALTLRGGRIVDIPGFDDRAAAAGRAGVPV